MYIFTLQTVAMSGLELEEKKKKKHHVTPW